MEDAATAEISRSQIWQCVKHGKIERDHDRRILDEEMEKIRNEVADETRKIFEQVALSDEFPDFLTLPAYDYID
jgi:malate synthase